MTNIKELFIYYVTSDQSGVVYDYLIKNVIQ